MESKTIDECSSQSGEESQALKRMDPMADLEQNLKLSDLEKRLSQVELKLENIMKLVQLVVTLAGAALGVDLIPLMA